MHQCVGFSDFSVFTVLWYNHCCLIPTFLLPRSLKIHHTSQPSFPFLLSFCPPSSLLSISLSIFLLGISYKWNHTISCFYCLASFTQDNVFKVIMLLVSVLHFLLQLNNIQLHKYNKLHLSVYQLMDIWVVSTFMDIMNNRNIYIQVFMRTYVFISPRYIPGIELLGHVVTLPLTF